MSFAARFGAPTREELTRLARKYDALADLRDRRDRGDGVAPRAELSALAREFPGALRELDTLQRAEIERRRASLRAALSGDAVEAAIEPWISWMIAYHATMRAALFVKARLARGARGARGGEVPEGRAGEDIARPVDANDFDQATEAVPVELARHIAESASRDSGLPIDELFVHAVARPPARRLNAAVFERLGRELGVSAEEMWQALFPTRRIRRF